MIAGGRAATHLCMFVHERAYTPRRLPNMVQRKLRARPLGGSQSAAVVPGRPVLCAANRCFSSCSDRSNSIIFSVGRRADPRLMIALLARLGTKTAGARARDDLSRTRRRKKRVRRRRSESL